MSAVPENPVLCHACGRSWDHHPALEVACPKCSAQEGAQCARPSGHSGNFVQPHVCREQRAVDEGVLELCPQRPTLSGEADYGADPGHEAAEQPALFGTA